MTQWFFVKTTRGRLDFSVPDDIARPLDTHASGENLEIIRDFIQAYVCLLADSPLNETSLSDKPPSLFREWFARLTTGSLKDLIVSFSSLSHKLVSQPTLYGSGSSTGPWIPEFRDTPVFREYHEWYKTGNPVLLRYLYTFLAFGKKLKYTDDAMHSVAFRNWEGVEERLRDLVLDDRVCAGLARIMRSLCPPLALTSFRPKYGPGRVSEKGVFGSIAKNNTIRYDAKLDRAFFKSHFVSYGLLREEGFQMDKIIPDPPLWNRAIGTSRRFSRLKFVPKDITKSRSICAEPNIYMFFQQGLADLVIRSMRKGPARRFIDIRDQSRNRDLALYGSITGDIDTIDLSSASDSVHVDLVKKIFPREYLFFLLATRTSQTELPDKTLRSMHKFAPMGSALCFPIQCLIFTSIVIYAAMHEASGLSVDEVLEMDSVFFDDVPASIRKLFATSEGYIAPGHRTRYQPASIYGDDICVDSSLTPYVAHLLTSLGFEVNTSKSFVASQCFRESCGGYYFQGEDITPLYFRVEHGRKLTAGAYASIVSCANHAGDLRYLNLRRVVIHMLLSHKDKSGKPFPILFSDDRRLFGIFSTNPRNQHLERRYNADYQRDEVLCMRIVTDRWIFPRSPTEMYALEKYLHLQWWASHISESVPDDFPSGLRRDPSGTRLRRGWTPA